MKFFDYSGKYCSVPPSVPKKQKRNTLLILICCVLLLCIGVAIFFVWANNVNTPSADLPESTEPSIAETTLPTEETTVPTEATEPEQTIVPPETTEPEETEPPVKEIMPKFLEYYERNSEFYGWLTIDGTKIDYPVMQSTDDNDEYLRADMDGNYKTAGTLFVDIKCKEDSDNLLVYGHNMKNGSMFATLLRYEKESFWEDHPTFVFSDLYEDHEYEVLAVFRDKVYKKSDTCFKFYQFINAENEEDFDYAISQFKEKSIYDTGVEAEYGDKLITLITCAYHVDNGRFVVVARRK